LFYKDHKKKIVQIQPFTDLCYRLWYSGAADEHLMLSIFVAYFGMALVPHQLGREQRANVRMPWRLIFITAALDMIALICGTTGMFYIGSGVYQVIHSSVSHGWCFAFQKADYLVDHPFYRPADKVNE